MTTNKVRKVKKNENGNLSCCCRLFEMRGVLCSHAIKVMKDELQIMEIPLPYILKRWSRNARSESVQDLHGRNIEADPKLEQRSRYKSVCSLFNKVSSRGSELKGTYELCIQYGTDLVQKIETMIALHVSNQSLDKDDATCSFMQNVGDGDEGSMDKENPIRKAKGLKKRKDPFRGKRWMKSTLENSLVNSRKKIKSKQVY